MYKPKTKQWNYFTKEKDDVAEKSENKLSKYSELGSFGIRGLDRF